MGEINTAAQYLSDSRSIHLVLGGRSPQHFPFNCINPSWKSEADSQVCS